LEQGHVDKTMFHLSENKRKLSVLPATNKSSDLEGSHWEKNQAYVGGTWTVQKIAI